MRNATLKRFRETNVAVEKQWVSHKLSVCICSPRYPACNAHAPYCHLWPARLYSIFPHYLKEDTIFEKKKINWSTKSANWFSLQILSQTFFILRRIYIGLHVKYPLFLSRFNEPWTFSVNFRKIPKNQISWKSVQWEPSCSMRTDRQTDMTKLIVAFRQFCERA